MQTLYIVGITGMLGRALAEEASRKGYIVKSFTFDTEIAKDSIVVNCAGAIPAGKRQGADMVYANAVLPFQIAEYCEEKVSQMVHISTDCVFLGRGEKPIRYYTDPNPKELYGASKALGEKIIWEYPNMRISVVRTSFIGLSHGLLKWLIGQKEVDGYLNALWTGSTVWEASRGILEIIEKREPLLIEHLATERVWSKCEVLQRLNALLDLKVNIKPTATPRINRALDPTTIIRDIDNHFVAYELWEKFRS